jgi:hypothetical protein
MRRSRVVLAMVLMLSAAAAQGQPAQPQPVPASDFEGKTLVERSLGFSVESPGTQWTWTRTENPAMKLVQFHCSNTETAERFVIAVVKAGAPQALSKADADGYISGVAQGAERQGWKVSPGACTPWPDVPGGWRCAFSAESKEKERAQQVHYVVATGRFYSVQYPNLGREEPREFKEFVASFKLLK